MTPPDLRRFTPARVGLGRAGHALPTADMFQLQLAEVYAREAVHCPLDTDRLTIGLESLVGDFLIVKSKAGDRSTYIRRPDWGRRLDNDSRDLLESRYGSYDVVFIIADGLSAEAVHLHASGLLTALLSGLSEASWRVAPLILVHQGRVAIADEIGELLGASLSVIMIGERPGLSASDSLGVYLTWNPHVGLSDAHRNCLSNIREGGLSYRAAADRLLFLMNEAHRLKLSGIRLKEGAHHLLATHPDHLVLPGS